MAQSDARLDIVAVIAAAGMAPVSSDLAALRGVGKRMVIADEIDERPAAPDCRCTTGAVCRRNGNCPRLARTVVER